MQDVKFMGFYLKTMSHARYLARSFPFKNYGLRDMQDVELMVFK